MPLTAERVAEALRRLVDLVILALSAAAAAGLTGFLFSDGGYSARQVAGEKLPYLGDIIGRQDLLAYGMVFILALLVSDCALRLVAIPLIRKVVCPLSDRLSSAVAKSGAVIRRLCGGVWLLPKAVSLVLMAAVLCYAYTGLSGNTAFDVYLNRSAPYRFIEERAMNPIVGSEAVRRLPDVFGKFASEVVRCLSPEGRKLMTGVFINGETVGDAVMSSPEIDNLAIDLVDWETDDTIKARILYDWVCENIAYDNAKVRLIEESPFESESGAVPAFSSRTGVCFDMACLYVAMCRAVDVPVRLMTGEGQGGSGWTGHSWNQIYNERTDRWLNVDVTFGRGGKLYFDNADFDTDHRDAFIHGEWA
jgi:hypothetical protein